MNKIIKQILILSCLVFLLILPYFVFAGTPLESLKNVAEEGGYSKDINEFYLSFIIGDIIQAFLSLLGVIFVVLMIYGGFKWMKASGRSDEVEKAQDIIRQAIIGLIITVSAYAISTFVIGALS